ncbi:MAG: 4Fe-4S dicluster domain-containing protein, partial [Acidobacteria bacterium]|nr:4Fe-4S dicluster domain-containing protein [Acidobacteriota bacterium]NIM62034.1 4Fe-4S dicluster domain-containing protein [Acidobacteriota bacterium]NIQ85838.1 4Fe-4S dicluster domain-containing protein [Acidobacteriota bacterium]NIT11389.1 4Fe-4S dicluster domain-containing protein [Acidobacteriota bacterium]
LYLPGVLAGLVVTLRHMFRKKDTIQYPEQQREFGERYRGVPALVKDQDGREKCVACYMCQWVCPPLAITIEAAEYPADHELHQIEKYPKKFEINMLRCIYCGLCEEACPEEAIFMSKTYVVTGLSRELMIFDKEKLYEIGGARHDEIKKWSEATKGPRDRSHVEGDSIAPTTAETH